MKVVFKLTDRHVQQLYVLYQTEWWAKGRSLADTYKVVQGSTLTLAVVNEGDDLIGFARVLTDGVFKAFIFDVIVRASERGNGIGDLIINTILAHEIIAGVQHLELYCRAELIPYYHQFGFTTEVGPITLMRRTKP